MRSFELCKGLLVPRASAELKLCAPVARLQMIRVLSVGSVLPHSLFCYFERSYQCYIYYR